MDNAPLVVLFLAGAATGALLYYVKVRLPEELEARYRSSFKAFSTAIELRFPGHSGVTERVVSLSQLLGKRMGFDRRRLRRLEMIARLRDIGLCAIPYKMVNSKPRSQWTEAERATYDRHPEVSGAMLELVPSLRHLAHPIRCHHAPYDGSAGPVFPSRGDLPLEARILRVVVDYVWHERNQGDLLARQQIRDGEGKLYDPAVVREFLGMLRSSGAVKPRELVETR